MRKKMVLFGLALMLLTGAILFGSLVYMTNMVLPKGSAEEFAALRPEVLYRDADGKHYGSNKNTASQYVKNLTEDDPLHNILGGFFWIDEEKDDYILFYVTEPTEQLREQLQQKPELEYCEVALAKCDFTLRQLTDVMQKMDAYLETAPASVRNSVQVNVLSPRENRIAVYVKNWSVFDQLKLAKAMGPMAQCLYVIEEDLDTVFPQMQFILIDDWAKVDGEQTNWVTPEMGGTCKEIPIKELYAAYGKMDRIRDEYTDHMVYCTGWMNWRIGGLYVEDTNMQLYGALRIGSQMKIYTGNQIFNDMIGVRPARWGPEESYAFYDSWGKTQEYLTKAIFHEMADFEYPIVVLHSY